MNHQLMQRELCTFPLPQHVRFRLQSNGFTVVEDLHNMGPVDLANETRMTQEEAAETLQLVFKRTNLETNGISIVTAADLYTQETSKPPIPTFCQELDSILGGGIPLKCMTELCGGPGCGKTQLCMQLCTTVQIPECCGGLDGEAVYIDTEGSFVIDRLSQIVEATVDACIKITKSVGSLPPGNPFTSDAILERIHYFRCMNYTELIARITLMPEFLKIHPKVRLVVIDSISFHFRYGFENNYIQRARVLTGISQSLIKIANQFHLAVVLTNQMTMRVQDGNSRLIPALGESWGHACTVRVILSWEQERRKAYLYKSPWRKDAKAYFKIAACGVRDYQSLLTKTETVSSATEHEAHCSKDSPNNNEKPPKRLKLFN